MTASPNYGAVITQSYRNVVEATINAAASIKANYDPSFTYVVAAFPEKGTVSKEFAKSIKYWLKTSVYYFYHNGHGGGPSKATDWAHDIMIGSNVTIANYNSSDGWQKISMPRVAQNKSFKFVFLSGCNTNGKDIEHGNANVGYMTPTPNYVWPNITHINPTSYEGCFVGYNGQSLFYVNLCAQQNCWYRWAMDFWGQFGQNNYISDCITHAGYHSGAQDTSWAPWTFNNAINRSKMIRIGDTRAVP